MRSRLSLLLAGALVVAGTMLGATLPSASASPAFPTLAPGKPKPPKPKPSSSRPKKPSKPKPGNQGGGNNKPNKPNQKKKKPGPPPPPRDTTPPATPLVGSPKAGRGGYVSVAVAAEAGSRVTVTSSGGSVVAVGTGTGGYSTLGWTTSTGKHFYAVRATDGAGNTSGSRSFSVVADATPPMLRGLTLEQGNRNDTRSRAAFTTERGAAYRIVTGGTVVRRGVAGKKGTVRTRFDVGNGRPRVTVIAEDAAGNPRTEQRRLRVKIGSPRIDVKLATDPTQRRQVVRVSTTPNAATTVVRIPGQGSKRVGMRRGSKDIPFRLPDGTHEGGTVKVRDSQGRTGTVALPTVVVDTTPPDLQVSSDPVAAAEGDLALTVTADEGAEVTWQLLEGEEVVDSGSFTADGSEQQVEKDVAQGSFDLVVSATDPYERTTSDLSSARIGPDPTPMGLIAFAVLALLALAGLLGRGLLLLRRHPPAWLQRTGARLEAATAQAKALATIPGQRVAFELAEDQWYRRQEALEAFLRVAGDGTAGKDPAVDAARDPAKYPAIDPATHPEIHLLAHEQLRYSTPARLFEAAGEDAETLDVYEGDLVTTDLRFTFVGQERRDWWQGLVEGVRHEEGDDLTMVKRWHEDAWSGLEYADPDVTRLYLDLALAEKAEEREACAERAAALLREHEAARPVPPRVPHPTAGGV